MAYNNLVTRWNKKRSLMELQLEPREGEKLLSPEEREQMKRRIRQVEPEELAQFNEAERQRIKILLARLIALSEHVHHDMEDDDHVAEHQEHIEQLHMERQRLFDKADAKTRDFVRLIDLCAAEPWLEYEVFMHRLEGLLRKKYFETKHGGGVEATLNNPFLMQTEDITAELHMDLTGLTRITEREIESLIFRFSLEDLVETLINARKIITGQFWDDEYYDL